MSAQSNRRAGEPSGGVSFSFSYKELLATGLSGALLAFLASKWHIPGVLLGALSPMASLVIMAIIKAYSSGAAIGGPRLPGFLYIIGAFWWFASRPAEMRQSILSAGLRAGAAASIVSASAVVGTQALAGEDLTCLIWEECRRGISPPRPGPLPNNSPKAVRAAPNTSGVGGGGFAFLAAALLLGSGVVSAVILRRRS
jgi:hypothetical protein